MTDATIPLNILLVEDSEIDAKITKRAFDNAALKNNLFVVNSGQECFDFIRQEGEYQDAEKYPRPDIILLDINMPGMNGFEVLKNIKQDNNYCAVPVLMFTGSKNEDDIIRSYANGANGFIQKAVDYDNFIEVLNGFNYYWQVINRLPGRRT